MTKKVLANQTTSSSQDSIKAYRLLMHAEIEAYIETLATERITRSLEYWTTKKVLKRPILSVMAYCKNNFHNPPELLRDVSSNNDFEFRMHSAIGGIKGQINNNNGIKEKNIVPILVQLGTDYTSINQTLLNNLSSFGKLRGDVAHKSYRVLTLINPMDEKNYVQQILTDLEGLDTLLTNLD